MTFLKPRHLATLLILIALVWAGCNNTSTTEDKESTPPAKEQATEDQAEQEQTSPSPQDKIQPATDVSEKELDDISTAIAAMRKLEQGSQQKMIEAIQQTGMDVQRFSQIMQQEQNPDTTLDLSAEEEELYNKAKTQLQSAQMELQSAYEDAIEENNLTVERYQAIMMAVQGDTSLQRKINERMAP